MTTFKTPQIQRGFIQYIVLGIVLVLIAATIAVFQSRKPTPSPNELTASLVGSGGVTITTPDNNATLTSPVHVTATVSASTPSYGSVKTMQMFADNTLVYQGPGTTVDTNVVLSAGATRNLTVLALKKNGALEGSATVYVTVVTATPTPLPLPPSASSVPPLPPVPSP